MYLITKTDYSIPNLSKIETRLPRKQEKVYIK